MEKSFDAILIGNVDLLGYQLIHYLVSTNLPVIHHAGFVTPPFPPEYYPQSNNYLLVAASAAVRTSLVEHGFPIDNNPIVFPGVRHDLFTPGSGLLSRALQRGLNLFFFYY